MMISNIPSFGLVSVTVIVAVILVKNSEICKGRNMMFEWILPIHFQNVLVYNMNTLQKESFLRVIDTYTNFSPSKL